MTETPLQFYKRARKHGDIPHMTMAEYTEVQRELAKKARVKNG